MANPRVFVHPDLDGLSRAAAESFVETANRRVAESGKFFAALSGGSTPRRLYQMMAAPAFASRVDGSSIHLFQVDERCVPPDHASSNFTMIREAWLAPASTPSENFHRIEGEANDPAEASRRYAGAIERVISGREGNSPRFDLIFLGMGADGHVASLFPGSAALAETTSWVAVSEPGPERLRRITLTLPVLNAAARIVFLVSGGEKAEALARALEGRRGDGLLPVQSVQPTSGQVTWFVDSAAACKLRVRATITP